MSSKIILASALSFFIFFAGCKAPSCSTLSWGETKVEEPGSDLKYSAGDQCENINDYWDIDIESIISKIQKMRFVKNDVCKKQNTDGEYIEYQCPEFIPETIEFGEVSGCKFGTPPSEKEDCVAGSLVLYFNTDTFFEKISWSFDIENPEFYLGEEDEIGQFDIFRSENEEKTISGQFKNDNLDIAVIRFKWTEVSNEGMEEEKKALIEYLVESKE